MKNAQLCRAKGANMVGWVHWTKCEKIRNKNANVANLQKNTRSVITMTIFHECSSWKTNEYFQHCPEFFAQEKSKKLATIFQLQACVKHTYQKYRYTHIRAYTAEFPALITAQPRISLLLDNRNPPSIVAVAEIDWFYTVRAQAGNRGAATKTGFRRGRESALPLYG